MIGSAGVCC